ncbi:hypothetical protein [Alkaliphilus serpentinus]|uniref:Uncharacterized protein n=1 Tax=Alkaliphilus serpentinus TaxID=1482731 RepID=A0A833M706_9FIRM|nr:hypothetical protein [Alkaliphilus serpentinus]KAB3529272.1 hypothetical protein F8153_09700 [Alkaliphilus serpentinus]
MTEVKKNDFLSSFLGNFGSFGKGNNSWLILIIVLIFLFGNAGTFWGKLDENLILVFVLFIVLLGGTGSFKF